MDPLSAFLDGPRVRDAFVLRAVLAPPWSLRIADGAPLTVVAVLRGTAMLAAADGSAWTTGIGDVLIVNGTAPYVMTSEAGRRPDIVVLPGQRCTTPDGVDLAERLDLGVRTWGNGVLADADSTVLLVGTYHHHTEVGRRWTTALPTVSLLRAGTAGPVLDLIADQIGRDDPGQQTVLDRLLDVLLIGAIRAVFGQVPGVETSSPVAASRSTSWFTAAADHLVGPALRLMQNDPAAPWTVAGLADAVGVSRAQFARRFTELMGEPPMTYLTGWRMTLAADLLAEPSATVTSVGRAVGYDNPFTFSTAFKRVHGRSPRAYRSA